MIKLNCELHFFCLSNDGRTMFGEKRFTYLVPSTMDPVAGAENAKAQGRLLAATTWDVPVDRINITSFSTEEVAA